MTKTRRTSSSAERTGFLPAAGLGLGLASVALVCRAGPSASAPRWERSASGETAVIAMRHAPFPHASRSEGFRSGDRTYPRDPHYVDSSVAVFIPAHFRAGEHVDLLFYFHGHNNTIAKAFEQFRLREQAAASGQNLILVFPEGPRDAADSGGGKLEEPGGLKRLADEVLEVLAAERKVPHRRLGRVLLAGHSGAYRVISYTLQAGGLEAHVSGVCLLDATYGRLDVFAEWAGRRADNRLFSIFTDHLADENVALMTRLRKRDVPYDLLDAGEAGEADIRRHRILFLHASGLTHDGTVVWLEPWLRAVGSPVASQPAGEP